MSELARTQPDALNGGKAPVKRLRGQSPIVWIIVLLLVIVVAIFGYRYWRYSMANVGTDDAQLAGDVVQIAPQVSGTISAVYVEENQQVKAGEKLVTLDDETYRASVEQAQANLDAAIAQARGAGVAVTLTNETGNAQLTQSEGLLQQADSSIASAKDDTARATAAVANMQAMARSSKSSISAAQAALAGAVANKARAQSAITAAEAQLQNARDNARAAHANVNAAQANADKAEKDKKRYDDLLAKGAISAQLSDQAEAAAQTAAAQLDGAKRSAEAAESTVLSKKADLESAREQLNAATAAITQAQAQLAIAHDQAAAAEANVAQAKAQRDAAEQSIQQAIAHREQAIGQVQQAHTAPVQVNASRSTQSQAMAKISQARAALTAAQIQLKDTIITAPVDGRISKKSAEVGALVQPGTPLMAIVRPNLWVVANFKETQLTGMRPGERATIIVDSFPDRRFHGHVDSISAATGATFALLPPDNATGNFTKVVQRIPVKIVLDSDQPDLDLLRAGMSVQATVSLH